MRSASRDLSKPGVSCVLSAHRMPPVLWLGVFSTLLLSPSVGSLAQLPQHSQVLEGSCCCWAPAAELCQLELHF